MRPVPGGLSAGGCRAGLPVPGWIARCRGRRGGWPRTAGACRPGARAAGRAGQGAFEGRQGPAGKDGEPVETDRCLMVWAAQVAAQAVAAVLAPAAAVVTSIGSPGQPPVVRQPRPTPPAPAADRHGLPGPIPHSVATSVLMWPVGYPGIARAAVAGGGCDQGSWRRARRGIPRAGRGSGIPARRLLPYRPGGLVRGVRIRARPADRQVALGDASTRS